MNPLASGFHAVPPRHLATIVTHLELTARPVRRPAPEGLGLDLVHRSAPAIDLYRMLFRRIGADWLWASRLRMPDAELRAILHDPAVEVFALRREGCDVGMLELDFRDVPELAFFGVMAPLQGTGAARWLMNAALDRASGRGIDRLTVHTCTHDHPAALAFYRRTGFRPVRQEVEILRDPRLDGLLPRDAAPHVPLAMEVAAG
jgi:GNAT superfamily N-acetyltransferase